MTDRTDNTADCCFVDKVLTVTSGGSAARLCNRRMLDQHRAILTTTNPSTSSVSHPLTSTDTDRIPECALLCTVYTAQH